MERVSKKHKISKEPTDEEFGQCINETFDACFTHIPAVAIFSNLQSCVFNIFVRTLKPKNLKKSLAVLYSVLRFKICHFRMYIGFPVRHVPLFRYLYWIYYRELRLCTRNYNIPIDIVWMILERTGITTTITEKSLRTATLQCIRLCNYLNKYYLPSRRLKYPHKRKYFVWGTELADLLLKNEL